MTVDFGALAVRAASQGPAHVSRLAASYGVPVDVVERWAEDEVTHHGELYNPLTLYLILCPEVASI